MSEHEIVDTNGIPNGILVFRGHLTYFSPDLSMVSPDCATHLFESGYDIRMIQELLGHKDVSTTMAYAYVLNKGGHCTCACI